MHVGDVMEYPVDQVVTRQDHMGALGRLGQAVSAAQAEDARRVRSNEVLTGMEQKLAQLKAQIDDPPLFTFDSTIGGWKSIYNSGSTALNKARVTRGAAIKDDAAFKKWLTPLEAAYNALMEGFSQAKDDGLINAFKYTGIESLKTVSTVATNLTTPGGAAAQPAAAPAAKPTAPAPTAPAAKKEEAKKPAAKKTVAVVRQPVKEEAPPPEESFFDKVKKYAQENPAIAAGAAVVGVAALYFLFAGGSKPAPAPAAPMMPAMAGLGEHTRKHKKRRKSRKSKR
jgi:hypothetical protein